MQQMMLIGTKHDPHATERMDIAIADFIFSNGLPISLVECAKFHKLIQSARHIPPKYTPPYRKKMAGPLLDDIYQSTYDEQMRSLLKESKVFGIALFGDGATIQKVPMMIFLGSSPNNPFALLDIVDCTSEMAKGGKKDAKYIAGLLKPIISRIEETKDPNNQKTDHRGVVDLLLFDGAGNVQNAAKLASITYPCITVVHGAEHVVSLFFKDIFTKMPVFQCLSQFSKRCRNIFGSTRHGPHAIFKKHSIMHNNGIYIGFIKISECCMAVELIGLLRLLRLRNILRATIALKEFKEIWEKTFQREVIVLENNEFWKYLFTLCCSLYAPMRIL
jgi:hypothetical protein